jgi:hypothetical protein
MVRIGEREALRDDRVKGVDFQVETHSPGIDIPLLREIDYSVVREIVI